MTKPTGRPRGRPKTKEYATLMARIPQDLVERVHAYRHRRQTSVSDVIREGLEALLSTDDMLSYRYTDVPERKVEMSDTKEAVVPACLGEMPDLAPGYGFPEDLAPETAACPVLSERDMLGSRLREMWDGGQGLSYEKIAAQLSTEGVPIPSGKGHHWHKNMVARLVKAKPA